MSKAIFFLFFIFLSSGKSSAGKYLSVLSSEKSLRVEEVLEALPLRCEDSSNCPRSVAKVFYVGAESFDSTTRKFQRQIDSCSGFLLGGRYLVTAGHCLLSRESDLSPLLRPRLSDEQCAEFIQVGFLNGEHRSCKGIRFFQFHSLYSSNTGTTIWRQSACCKMAANKF